jgi:hypothetical protein
MRPSLLFPLGAGLVLLAPAAHAQVFHWSAPADGVWSSTANWDLLAVPNGSTESAVLGGFGVPYTVSYDINATIAALTVGAEVRLEVIPARSLGIAAGSVVNDGRIIVNPTAANNGTILNFSTMNGSFSGAGTVTLNAGPDLNTAYINANAGISVTNSAGHTIDGTGRIYAVMTNDSAIRANVAGKTLEIRSVVSQSPAGRVVGEAGGSAALANGGRINGGLLQSLSGGRVAVTAGNVAGVDGVTSTAHVEVDAAGRLDVFSGGLTDNATILVNPTAANNGTRLNFAASGALNGSGTLTLNAAPDLNTATIESVGGFTGTHGVSHTIDGTGRIYAAMINQGTIRANVAGKTLEIRSAITQQGAGRFVGDAGGSAALANGGVVTGGRFQSSGLGRVAVSGGNVGTIDGVTSTARLEIDEGGRLDVRAGGLTNNGTVIVNPLAANNGTRVNFIADATLAGSGTLRLNAGPDLNTAYIESLNDFTGTNGANHTIGGTGRIYGALINQGTIRGNADGKLLEIRNRITQEGAGRIVGDGGGSASLANGSRVIGGQFQSSGTGRVSVTGGNVGGVDGVINAGRLELDPGSRLDVFAGGLVNSGTMLVNPTQAAAGTRVNFAAADVVLGGAGVLTLNASSDLNTAYLESTSGFTGTNGPSHTITGNGNVYSALNNLGTIRGSSTSATAVVALRNLVDQSGGGRLVGDVGSPALAGATVIGGEFVGPGRVRALVGASGVRDVTNRTTFALDAGARVDITNLTNNGDVLVNATAGGGGTWLLFHGSQTLAGTGSVTLNAGADLNTAYTGMDGTTPVVTFGSGQTLRGRGRLYGSYVLRGTTSPGLTTGGVGYIDNLSGSISLASTHTLAIDLAGPMPVQFDRVVSNGPVTLAGSLVVSFVDGYNPSSLCTEFEIVRASSLTGVFASVRAPIPPDGHVWRVAYTPTTATLRLVCAADIGADCQTDFFDYLDFVAAFDAGDPAADFNGDNQVDFFDYLDFAAAFDAGC